MVEVRPWRLSEELGGRHWRGRAGCGENSHPAGHRFLEITYEISIDFI